MKPWRRRPQRRGLNAFHRPSRIPAAIVELLEPRVVLDGAAVGTFASLDELKATLIEAAMTRWKSLLGTRYPDWGFPVTFRDTMPRVSPNASGAGPVLVAGAADSHSGTNNQVEGVDEADLVETDGRFVYVLSGRTLSIVDVRDPAAPKRQSIALEYDPIAMFLSGDRLAILSHEWAYHDSPIDLMPAVGARRRMVAGILPVWSSPKVRMLEFDVSDPTAPRLARETKIDGRLVEARAIGDRVYVLAASEIDVPSPVATRDGGDLVYETESQYRERLEKLDWAKLLPKVTRTQDGTTVTGDLVGPTSIYNEDSGSNSLLTVSAFDLESDATGPASSMAILGGSAFPTVYASTKNLYLLSYQWGDWNEFGKQTEVSKTLIQKIPLGGSTLEIAASGTVVGNVLNAFSVDEHDDTLRIATTLDDWTTDAWRTSNNLYVLAQEGDALNVIGKIENLAPGERIYAARFEGETAYVETFRQIDPLFVIDLRTPTSPKLVGELKVPGFVRYLQQIDANHLLGIGRDADPETGRARELQLALFDVTDPANPIREATYSIDTSGWTWSAAEWEHHAISYFPETQTLVIPVQAGPAWAMNRSSSKEESGFWVFQVDTTSGFTRTGVVTHDSDPLRSLRIGDNLVTIAARGVIITGLLTPNEILGQTTIQGTPPDSGEVVIAIPVVKSKPKPIVIKRPKMHTNKKAQKPRKVVSELPKPVSGRARKKKILATPKPKHKAPKVSKPVRAGGGPTGTNLG